MDLKVLKVVGSANSPPPPLPPPPPPRLVRLPPKSSVLPSPDQASEPQAVDGAAAEEEAAPPLFTPYNAVVPWHTGPRALVSLLFPKYGHYCGPNWSSGRSAGSPFWDKQPIDWLDHCCYCHDVGYDSHDQAALYKADLEFLHCLQTMPQTAAGPVHPRNAIYARAYRDACITGLKTFLLPYRRMLMGKEDNSRKEI